MKGHPGCGKSTLARSIASALKIPLIDKDDIKDSIVPLQHQLTSLPDSLVNDLSLHATWQIASTQLGLGLSVLVDSTLSRKFHFDRLLCLAASTSARLIIIECKSLDNDVWRRRLEHRDIDGRKPATWQELGKLLEEYGGCTEYDVGDVPKMVVDMTATVPLEHTCSAVLDFIFCHAVSTTSVV
ncbi:hypothetical protein RIF29_17877 [Crotalaria pallida]|uniref:P-loop containing nucleoside triphosphate hydrolase protein n=1 Tax=Crotalaria pallida TaxID=3830 RepID=A0AAN9FHW7_CROPI